MTTDELFSREGIKGYVYIIREAQYKKFVERFHSDRSVPRPTGIWWWKRCPLCQSKVHIEGIVIDGYVRGSYAKCSECSYECVGY